MKELLARIEAASFPDGSVADVELWRDSELASDGLVFAAMVVVSDGSGRFVAVYSPRRQEWGIPGGGREPDETVVECAVREVAEETGLVLAPENLRPWGIERFAPRSGQGRWPAAGGLMQVFVADIDGVDAGATELALVARADDAVDPQWVTAEEFVELSGRRFWWPLVACAVGWPPER